MRLNIAVCGIFYCKMWFFAVRHFTSKSDIMVTAAAKWLKMQILGLFAVLRFFGCRCCAVRLLKLINSNNCYLL